MKISRLWIKISTFVFAAHLFGESAAYVYILPFDNIQNDPALDWISSA